MTEKELHRLRRQDLLQLLLLQSKEVTELQTKLTDQIARANALEDSNERIKARLNEKDATITHLVKRLNQKDERIAALTGELDELRRASIDEAELASVTKRIVAEYLSGKGKA